MTVCRMPLIVATVLALLVGCSSATGAGAGASRGKRVFIPGFGYMKAGEARKFLRETQNGPRALALQRAAARREGIALTPKELRVPLPPPEENAATVYAELGRLLKAKPLDPLTDAVRGSLGVRVAHTPEDVERLRKLLAERPVHGKPEHHPASPHAEGADGRTLGGRPPGDETSRTVAR